MIQIYSVMAEFERDQISARTKAALAAAKARGVKLGVAGRENLNRDIQRRKSVADSFAEKLRGVMMGFRAAGLTQRAMMAELSTLGIRPPNGRVGWSLIQVQRLLARL